MAGLDNVTGTTGAWNDAKVNGPANANVTALPAAEGAPKPVGETFAGGPVAKSAASPTDRSSLDIRVQQGLAKYLEYVQQHGTEPPPEVMKKHHMFTPDQAAALNDYDKGRANSQDYQAYLKAAAEKGTFKGKELTEDQVYEDMLKAAEWQAKPNKTEQELSNPPIG